MSESNDRNGEYVAGTSTNYEVYSSYLAQVNANFPQFQGLSEEEFADAINDPQVISTEVEVDRKKYLLPQLVPVTTFGWLNADFYERRYPGANDNGTLMHFTNIPGVEPGEVVKRRLGWLTDEEGILVIDYPSIDAEYPQRVSDLLGTLGINSSLETLGTQTYYAGKSALKRYPESDGPNLTHLDAFDKLVSSGGFDNAEYVNGTSMQRLIEGEEADNMHRFYEAAYATISDHPCMQGLNPEEFREMLANPLIAKVVYRKDGVAETLCLMTEDLQNLSWINPGFYKKMYPQKYVKNQVVWFPGIATDPDPAIAGHNFPKMAMLFAKLSEVGNNEIVVVFDTPDVNTGWLEKYIGNEVSKTPYVDLDFETLGSQRYCALRLTN